MSTAERTFEHLKQYIREIPDFPKAGITFKDISPLLQTGPIFRAVVDHIAEMCEEEGFEPKSIACPEARGFIFGAALAYRMGAGFVPIRKPGKLPHDTHQIEYELEYGTDKIEMHLDAVSPGDRVLLVDDVLATGGTMRACVDLLAQRHAVLEGCVFLVELEFLNGRSRLGCDGKAFSLIRYE